MRFYNEFTWAPVPETGYIRKDLVDSNYLQLSIERLPINRKHGKLDNEEYYMYKSKKDIVDFWPFYNNQKKTIRLEHGFAE